MSKLRSFFCRNMESEQGPGELRGLGIISPFSVGEGEMTVSRALSRKTKTRKATWNGRSFFGTGKSFCGSWRRRKIPSGRSRSRENSGEEAERNDGKVRRRSRGGPQAARGNAGRDADALGGPAAGSQRGVHRGRRNSPPLFRCSGNMADVEKNEIMIPSLEEV